MSDFGKKFDGGEHPGNGLVGSRKREMPSVPPGVVIHKRDGVEVGEKLDKAREATIKQKFEELRGVFVSDLGLDQSEQHNDMKFRAIKSEKVGGEKGCKKDSTELELDGEAVCSMFANMLAATLFLAYKDVHKEQLRSILRDNSSGFWRTCKMASCNALESKRSGLVDPQRVRIWGPFEKFLIDVINELIKK